MKQTKVLNLYAGLGGNRKLWENVEVTAVEMDPKIAEAYQNNFPYDNIVIGDSCEYLLNEFFNFDYIWSSPPCQSHSKMDLANSRNKPRFFDPQLYQQIIFLKHYFKGRFVVENVDPYYKPLIKPSLKIGRHLFWSNYEIRPKAPPKKLKGFINKGTLKDAKILSEWLGVKYEKPIYYKNNHCPVQVLRNCVHPETGLHVYNEHKREGLFVFD
jgi:DNA (cytosine-5)-methyltransferase 1